MRVSSRSPQGSYAASRGVIRQNCRPITKLEVSMFVARIYISLFVSLLPMTAFAECGVSVAEISALRELLRSKPTLMAQSAIAQGDANFLGVAGYSVVVPGIDSSGCFVDRTFVRLVPGTTDAICSAEHVQLIRSATAFAAEYNGVIKEFLVTKGAIFCAK